MLNLHGFAQAVRGCGGSPVVDQVLGILLCSWKHLHHDLAGMAEAGMPGR
jgi:hypothetical protein